MQELRKILAFVAIAAALALAGVALWPRGAGKTAAGDAHSDGGADGAVGRGLFGVTRLNGQPAAGVELILAGPAGVVAGRSGADGRFQLAVADGRYALRAVGEGAAALLEGVVVGEADGGAAPLVVELQPAVRLGGWLRDVAGKPIAGEVTLAESAFSSLPMRLAVAADGSFGVTVLPGDYLLMARADGFAALEPRPVRAPGPSLELVLERGGSVEGRVVDGDGRPIAGARVEAAGEDGAPLGPAEGPAHLPGLRFDPAGELGILHGPIPFPPAHPFAVARGYNSDATGGFHIGGLPAGRVVVSAWHPDFLRGNAAPIELLPGGSATVKLVLERGQSLRGRVLDERGEPLAGAEVSTVDGHVALTDGRGGFTLAHLAPGTAVTARHEGFVTATHPAPGEGELELRLARAEGHLAGAVVDERGFPVEGARVELLGALVRSALSDRAGRFTIDGLGAGPFHLRASHADFAATEAQVGVGDDVQLQLLPGGGLDGDVRDPRTGQLPSGATLELIAAGRSRKLPLGKGGRFEATGIVAGRVELVARAPGYPPVRVEVEVPAGERPREVTARDVAVELVRGGAVFGNVRGDDGDPVANAEVWAGEARTRSDALGEFRLEGVEPGHATLSARDGARRGEAEVEVRGNEESRLDLTVR